jgi:hypothetical protein
MIGAAIGYRTIRSISSMYDRSAFGTVTLPSAFWCSSSSGIRIRGPAITVLVGVRRIEPPPRGESTAPA